MDYSKHYERLIERARHRTLVGYKERHHVIPRCMGGSNDKSNLADLTPEEHFIAHQLLHRMHPDKVGLIRALGRMNAKRYRRNKQYGWIRRHYSDILKGNQYGKGQPAWNKGIPAAPHVIEIMRRHAKTFIGEKNAASKLTADDIKEIRELVAFGLPQKDIAEAYGVKQAQISRVASGKRWVHMDADPDLQRQIEAACAAKRSGLGTPRGKLSDRDVQDIRRLIADGMRVKLIAEQYGVSTVQIYRVKTGTRRAEI